MKTVIIALSLLLSITYKVATQKAAKSPCARYDSRESVATGNAAAVYYIEVCAIPNEEGKPALSVVFNSSPDRLDAMRIYSNAAGKPLSLDGVYVERRGQKQFILHRTEIEWADGSRTQLETMEPKKRKKLDAVVEAAAQLLKMAAETRRVSPTNDVERSYRNTVFEFLFKYKLSVGK